MVVYVERLVPGKRFTFIFGKAQRAFPQKRDKGETAGELSC